MNTFGKFGMAVALASFIAAAHAAPVNTLGGNLKDSSGADVQSSGDAPAPAAKPAAAPQVNSGNAGTVNFTVLARYKANDVKSVVAALKGKNLKSVTVKGYTNAQPGKGAASDAVLSQTRANVVKAALVKAGIPAGIITATGAGQNGTKTAEVSYTY